MDSQQNKQTKPSRYQMLGVLKTSIKTAIIIKPLSLISTSVYHLTWNGFIDTQQTVRQRGGGMAKGLRGEKESDLNPLESSELLEGSFNELYHHHLYRNM